MKIRIKFTKEEPVKYLGHLDILRFFQKCFVRAGVKMLYTEGFNPHQKLSFGLPLGVGIISSCEYLDADIAEGQDLEDVKNRLNGAAGEGFRILEIRQVKEKAQSLMSIIAKASYEIRCLDETFFVPGGFMAQEAITVLKKGKKGVRETDIKPLILKMEPDGTLLKVLLSAGSENNLNPELLLKAVCSFNDTEYKIEDFEIKRTGLFCADGTDLIDHETILK